MIIVVIDQLSIYFQHVVLMSERTLNAVIGKDSTLQRFKRHDPELLEPGKFRYQVDLERLAKDLQPIVICEIFKGKNSKTDFAVTDIGHDLKFE